MPLVRCQVVIPADTSIPEDACVNTWGFNVLSADIPTATDITADLKIFYDAWSTYRANSHSWAAITTKWYNLAEPPPRAPFAELVMGANPASSTGNLPSECSLVLSFQGAKVSGELQRRRRGRVYLGPMGSVANNSSDGRPESLLRTQVRDAAGVLLNTSDTETWSWVVISEATGTPVGVNVTDGWVDNSWDTQRRRGAEPTSRLTFT